MDAEGCRRKAPYEAGGEVVSLWWQRIALNGYRQDPQTVPAPAPFLQRAALRRA